MLLFFIAQLERLIEKNFYLHQSAREAYRTYLQAYASHGHKSAFDVNKLDLQRVAKAFGFTVPPRVNLSKGLSARSVGFCHKFFFEVFIRVSLYSAESLAVHVLRLRIASFQF